MRNSQKRSKFENALQNTVEHQKRRQNRQKVKQIHLRQRKKQLILQYELGILSILKMNSEKLQKDKELFRLQEIKEVRKRLKFEQVLWFDLDSNLYSKNQKFLQFSDKYIISIFSNPDDLKIYVSQLNKQYCLVVNQKNMKQEVVKKLRSDKRQLKLIKFSIQQQHVTKSQFPYLNKEELEKLIKKCSKQINEVEFNRKNKIPNFMIINEQNKKRLNKDYCNQCLMLLPIDRKKGKIDFIKFAKQFKKESEKEIEELQNFYPVEEKNNIFIQYYTKDIFFSKIINQTIRSTFDSTILSYIRLPFYDVYHAILNKSLEEKMPKKVYRGCEMFDFQIKSLKESIGGYISMNGFLSTTKNKEIAEKNFMTNTLLQITIANQERVHQIQKGFACIQGYSRFKSEQEVLFNPMSIFKVISVSPLKENFLCVKLQYGVIHEMYEKFQKKGQLNKHEKDLLTYENFRLQIGSKIRDQGDALYFCGENKMAENYYKQKLSILSQGDRLDKLRIYHRLGLITKEENEEISLFHHGKQLQIEKNIFGARIPNEKTYFNNIGTIFYKVGKFSQANSFFSHELSEESMKNQISQIKTSLDANRISNIALIHKQKNQFELALKYMEKVLAFYEKSAVGKGYYTTLNNIAAIYYKMEKYEESQKFYLQSLHVINLLLGKENIEEAMIFSNLGSLERQRKNYPKAIQYIQKSLQIKQSILGKSSIPYAKDLMKLGQLEQISIHYEASQNNYLKSEAIIEQVLGYRHELYADIQIKLGQFYLKVGRKEEAIEKFEKSRINLEGLMNQRKNEKLEFIKNYTKKIKI